MLHIKVVGSGCMNCEKLAAMCQTVIIEKEIEGYVEKITDREKITELGIMMTPGLIINDKVVSSGKIPTQSTLEQWILNAANKSVN
ncbi:MAG: thioredoxin family protein [Ignavibacteria bacterium]|nr:thioredoxin family protein [Bacteroidota bacterium]MBL7128803.1 thioredoxin family protein [Ignavibacteria bacterium]